MQDNKVMFYFFLFVLCNSDEPQGFFDDLALTLMILITIAPSVDPGCKRKPEFGICNRPKKYYFAQDKSCQKYSPLECKGNDNSFNTKKACLTTCGDCASKPKKRTLQSPYSKILL